MKKTLLFIGAIVFASVSNAEVTGGLTVAIRKATYFDQADSEKLEKARRLLELVVNSEEFKQRIYNFVYLNKLTFVQNNGLTNEKIYQSIIAGAEQFPQQTPQNQTIDLYAQLYTSSYRGRNVIGYTTPSTSTIFMNTYFYDYASSGEIAGNMMHEWLHKLGFDHDYKATARRSYSVPYAIGDIVEELARKY